MTGIAYELDDRLARAALDRLQREAMHPRGAMEAIGAHFVFSSQRNIERETTPEGQPWKPLSPRTAAKRSGRGRRGTEHMLRVKNRLYASISYAAMDNSVEWGSNVKYARIHQLGGVIDMASRHGAVTLKSIRKKGGGIRSRFARYGAKGSQSRVVSIRGHQVVIPARPYLGISPADQARVPEIVVEHLQREAGA